MKKQPTVDEYLDTEPCPVCKGKGYVVKPVWGKQRIKNTTYIDTCTRCQGTGRVVIVRREGL